MRERNRGIQERKKTRKRRREKARVIEVERNIVRGKHRQREREG